MLATSIVAQFPCVHTKWKKNNQAYQKGGGGLWEKNLEEGKLLPEKFCDFEGKNNEIHTCKGNFHPGLGGGYQGFNLAEFFQMYLYGVTFCHVGES